MTDISLIILTCNRPTRCVDSAWHNTLAMQGLRAETIVVNNGALPVSLPAAIAGIPCRVIQMPANLGAAARNDGIRAATGEFILTLDDDAYMDPDLVPQMLTAFKDNPAMGAVAFRIRNAKKDEEEGCLLPTVFHGCACGFRKSAIIKAGGYPTDTLYYGEEYDVTFRLYGAGFRIGFCTGPQWVRHDRDPAGRSAAHIIQLLVRNNTRFLWKHFPAQFIPLAFRDVLQRYRLVAAKENVSQGYLQGLCAIPSAIHRGLLHRQPMRQDIFLPAMILDKVERTGRRLLRAGAAEVLIGGVGKFPSLWLAALKRNGIRVRAFLDTNTCWKDQKIGGIPVAVTGADVATQLDSGLPCLVGAASLPENENWSNLLMLEHGYRPGAHQAALSSPAGIIDLFNFCRITEFWPEIRAFQGQNRRGMRYASRSDGNVSSESATSRVRHR